jgi:predicted RNA binding protein YcfA (HicA-like mRNA interferase family)
MVTSWRGSEKLLAKARANPKGLSFDEFETLLAQRGFVFKRQSGSHRVWMSPAQRVIPIQSDKGRAKAYQVLQALRMIEDES